jgi:hypothetical protein
MSHFAVLARLTEKRLAAHPLAKALKKKHTQASLAKAKFALVEAVLAEMLAPYNENSEDERFIAFNDQEDAVTKKFNENKLDRVKLDDGTLASPYAEGMRGRPTIEVPIKELYKTVEEFADGYHGYKRDPRTKRIGYWRCKEPKWDWYLIGGRWTGFFPVKPGTPLIVGKPGVMTAPAEDGHADVCHAQDIDLDGCFVKQVEDAKGFWLQWQEFLGGKKFGGFEGPRERALNMGLLDVVQGPHVPAVDERCVPWKDMPHVDPDRASWNDVAKIMTEEHFMNTFIDYFDPLRTYAALDDSGWHEPGKMGWFGMDSATADSKVSWAKAFREKFINPAQPQDILVCVDCHT